MGKKKRKKNKRSSATAVRAQFAHELAWDAIGEMAADRAGRGPQLKGVVHEVAWSTKKNLDPGALFRGESTRLTGSVSARELDAVTTRAGKVVERAQLKDLTSQSGIADLERRLGRGQYRTARLVGTEETAAAWSKRGHRKAMDSSGISSRRTARVAENSGSKVRGGSVASNLRDIGGMAGGAAATGAVFGAAAEAVTSYGELSSGRISGGEFAGRVATTATRSGAAAGVKTAAALGLKEGAKQVAIRSGSEAARRLAGSNVGTAVAFAAVDQVVDVGRFLNGDIDGAELGTRTVANTGTAGGGLGGATLGAAVGTAICPGIGTVLGSVVGGVVGSVSGGAAGKGIGRWLFGR